MDGIHYVDTKNLFAIPVPIPNSHEKCIALNKDTSQYCDFTQIKVF
jgi:hypothetical protein